MSMSSQDYAQLVALAIAEDVGSGDVTTALTVDLIAPTHATIRQKQPGVIFGHDVAEHVFREVDPTTEYARVQQEGVWSDGGEIASISGQAAALLTGERVALNFLIHLSGVATAAANAVRAIEGTGAQILDTRKTTPGMRALEKAAVAAGGATNHRQGLYDAILIKENHIAAAGGITAAISRCREGSDLPLEVEVRNTAEIDEALAAGANHLLLDNMDNDQLRAAVKQVDGHAKLEASGGYRLENVRGAAETGVDFISMGSITHGAPALDLSMIIDD
ncbi:MAG: carboxylating nicotinate-nucleotide diphosphorylase [Thermoleophilaceae bacterium]|nr:carboxylating nicotinate-nucleotide diphosphorylase [Thermoleophilaceae bacterium]